MGRRRISEPVPKIRNDSKGILSNVSDPETAGGSDDLEQVILTIRDRYKRKLKEEQGRNEKRIKDVVQKAIDTSNSKLQDYHDRMESSLAQLKKDVTKELEERDKQAKEFEQAYQELKVEDYCKLLSLTSQEKCESLIKTIRSMDKKSHKNVEIFFNMIDEHEKQVLKSTKETFSKMTAIVPDHADHPKTNPFLERIKRSKAFEDSITSTLSASSEL